MWLTGNGGRLCVLLMKTQNGAVHPGFDNSEFRRKMNCNRERRNAHIRMHSLVEVNHVTHVHAIDMVSAEDRYDVLIEIINQI